MERTRVRLATEDDIAQIVDIANHAAHEGVANFATQPESLTSWQQDHAQALAHHPWLVAYLARQSNVVGFAKASPHATRGAYAWTGSLSVYLRPQARGHGVGRQLYGCLVSMMRELGFVSLVAGITHPNPASERLHAGVGFVQCGVFHRVGFKMGRFHDVTWWELPLRPHVDTPPALGSVSQVWKQHCAGCNQH